MIDHNDDMFIFPPLDEWTCMEPFSVLSSWALVQLALEYHKMEQPWHVLLVIAFWNAENKMH